MRIDLILQCYGIENFLVRIVHGAVGIHQFVDHLLVNDSLSRQVFNDHILHTQNALSADTDIHLLYFSVQQRFKTFLDIDKRKHRLVDVVNNAPADIGRRFLLNDCQNGDAAIEVLLSRDTSNL